MPPPIVNRLAIQMVFRDASFEKFVNRQHFGNTSWEPRVGMKIKKNKKQKNRQEERKRAQIAI